MASKRQDINGLQRQQPNECRSFLFAVIKDRTICKCWFFLNNYQLIIVPKFVSGYGFLEHFIPYASRLIAIKYAADTV